MTTDRDVPAIVREQYAAIQDCPDITREEAELRFPELLNWLRGNVSIVDVMRDSGVALEPISPDSTGVLIGHCPNCDGPLLVRST